jgi:hypothetical protein
MDTARVSPAEMIAGAGGLGLFLFLFLDWFGPVNAWQGFDIVDVLLALIGLGVVVLVAARAAGTTVAVPGGTSTAIALAGFAATTVVLTFLLEGEERKIGLFLSLVAALAITYGGWAARRGTPRTTTGTATTGPAGTTAPPGSTGV